MEVLQFGLPMVVAIRNQQLAMTLMYAHGGTTCTKNGWVVDPTSKIIYGHKRLEILPLTNVGLGIMSLISLSLPKPKPKPP